MKLIALDLDGTLLKNDGTISQHSVDVLRRAEEAGNHVVISTGRPYCGLPLERLKEAAIEYAITANGGAIYRIADKECLYENAMEPGTVLPILHFLMTKNLHFDVFIDGMGYTPVQKVPVAQKLPLPDSLREYIITTRTRLDDICGFVEEHGCRVQKATVNFCKDENGVYIDRDEVEGYLTANPALETVCGGFANLEFTKRNVSKGETLKKLAQLLKVPMADTVAVGDTENDLSILNAAAMGIAMGNATPEVKAAADVITLSNEEDGVAAAVERYVLKA